MRRFLRRFIRQRYISYWVVLTIDTLIAVACTFAAYILVCYLERYIPVVKEIFYLLLASAAISSIASLTFQTYRHIVRHSTVKDLWRIVGNVIMKTVGMLIVAFFLFKWKYFTGDRRIVFLLFDAMLTSFAMIAVRVAMILIYDGLIREKHTGQEKILIYGVDEKSVALKLRLRDSKNYAVTGFYVYGKSYKSYRIAGLPIYYFTGEKDFESLIKRKNIKGILFSQKRAAQREQDRLLIFCKSNKIRTLIAPSINEAEGDAIFSNEIRTLKIEDLLGRDEISLDVSEIIADFQDKTVLVTGAAGSIGSELCRQIARLKVKSLILFDIAESPLHNLRLELKKKFPSLNFYAIIGDVRSKRRLRTVFERHYPQLILHAAAYKHVPLMEENPCEAVYVNVIGTRQVADFAVEYGAEKMIMVSTDKAVNPTSVMGASKRLAEIYIQCLGRAIEEGVIKGRTKFVTTRFGNVLGSNGSVIPLFRKQIENGGPVTVTHPDIIRFFMTIREACHLVLEAASMGKGGEIFVFEMGKPIKIMDLATRMIEFAGYIPHRDIKIEITGLRPGEKLYEEVLSKEEDTVPTSHKKIKIAKSRKYRYASIVDIFDQFALLSSEIKIEETVKLMKRAVPEFVSQNSEFEKFDEFKIA